MARVEEAVHVDASLAETWDAYFDADRWRSWVDGFGSVEESEGYPEPGGRLVWRSIPAGRGRVEERVLEHEHRRVHRVGFEDPEMRGELATTFAIEGEGTQVVQRLEYKQRTRGPIGWIGAIFFVKSQVRRSMQRTLAAFRREVEATSVSPNPRLGIR